jgi:hypothetical protein
MIFFDDATIEVPHTCAIRVRLKRYTDFTALSPFFFDFPTVPSILEVSLRVFSVSETRVLLTDDG